MKKKIYSLLLAFVLSASCITSCSNKKQYPLQEAFDYVPNVSFEEEFPELDWDDTKGVLMVYAVSSDLLYNQEKLNELYQDIINFYTQNGAESDYYYDVFAHKASEFVWLTKDTFMKCYNLRDGTQIANIIESDAESFVIDYQVGEQNSKCLELLYEHYYTELSSAAFDLMHLCTQLYLGTIQEDTSNAIIGFKDNLQKIHTNARFYYTQILDWCCNISETSTIPESSCE